MENSDHPYNPGASLMARVKQNIPRYYLEAASEAEQEAVFHWLFLGRSGPDWLDKPLDEPSAEDRYDQCYVVAEALRQELAAQHGFDPPCLYILIDPFGLRCEDAVYVAYLYTPDPLDLGQAVLLYATAVSAGQRFATLDQFTTYLAEQYAHLERGYRRAAASVVVTAD